MRERNTEIRAISLTPSLSKAIDDKTKELDVSFSAYIRSCVTESMDAVTGRAQRAERTTDLMESIKRNSNI